MAKSIEEIEMEINSIDTRLEILYERIQEHDKRLRELQAAHKLLENTPANTLARMKREGRI